MAALRTAIHRSSARLSSNNSPSQSLSDNYNAKKKEPRTLSRQFLPRWFLVVLFISLAAVSHVGKRRQLIWEEMIKNYLEPPPIEIKLTDKGKFGGNLAKTESGKYATSVAVGSNTPPASPIHLDDPNLLKDHLGVPLHIVFSTDCSSYQHWQSYLLFYSALRSKQPGTVTRIASGCSEEDAAYVHRWFDDQILPMSSRFRIHLTPHFSSVKDKVEGHEKKDYKYFNKPFGLRHWIEESTTMGLHDENGKVEVKFPDSVIILIDPDMIILRPITTDFSSDRDVIIPKRVLKDRKMRLEEGIPFGQAYGMGAHWKDFDMDSIIGKGVPSPARDLPRIEGLLRYAVGPPYLANAKDMHSIAVKWTDFVPGVYEQYPKLLAEMYGYCIAAAHLKLPHQKVESLMISDPTLSCEGWSFVESMPDGKVCSYAMELDHAKYPLPNVMHYCQTYNLGDNDHSFNKRQVSHTFFSCEGEDDGKGGMLSGPLPMMESGAEVRYNSTRRMRKGVYKTVELSRGEVKRVVFSLCAIRGTMNEALMYYREHHCKK
mmetsp:Transcript_54818/g.164058  ORF Transcript_54818/g.164058 Transcript_54818/m.164058 type:complete len:543 (-) Transcript_54818:1065-2693(-)